VSTWYQLPVDLVTVPCILEDRFADFLGLCAFAHCVKVQHGCPIRYEVFTLLNGPIYADFGNVFVVFALINFVRQSKWDVHVEDFGQHIQLFPCGDGFDSRYDGHVDACGPAFIYEFEVMFVVEEHLRYQEFGACIHFAFEVA
jgi:hypothetical protein